MSVSSPSGNGAAPAEAVLLCYDGSPESANAIARAGELLAPRRAVVTGVWQGLATKMLHVSLAGPPDELRESAGMIDEADRELAERSLAEGARIAEAAGFDARTIALHQDRNVWWTLSRYVETHDLAAVVVGARGRSRVARTLLGSTSSGLIRHAPAPVLVVPSTATGPGSGPVVFCDDGSDNARVAIGRGRRLLRGTATVISVWHPLVANVPYMVVGASMATGMAQELDEISGEQAQKTVAAGADVATAAGPDNCSGECVRFDGPAWRGLLEAAYDRDAAALVVGTRGMTGIAGTLGSVAAAITQHTPRPVLVVPPGEPR